MLVGALDKVSASRMSRAFMHDFVSDFLIGGYFLPFSTLSGKLNAKCFEVPSGTVYTISAAYVIR